MGDVPEPLIIESARKHGITNEAILHAFNHLLFRHEQDDAGLTMLIGGDPAGNLIEVGVVDSDFGPVIVHAMPARRRYLT